MTINTKTVRRKNSLLIAMVSAVALTNTLSGCDAGPSGGDGTITGPGTLTASPLLLLGGLAGVAAVVGSGSDDTGFVVDATGGSSDNGGEQTGNATDTNNSGGGTTNNDDSGGNGNNDGTEDNGSNGDGSNSNNADNADSGDSAAGNGSNSDDSSDSSGNENDSGDSGVNPDAVLVDVLQAPDWLRGMWSGTDAAGIQRVGFASADGMGTGIALQPLSGYADITEVCLHLIETNDKVFKYNIWYPLADGTEVSFDEQWQNNGDGTVLYTVSGDTNNELTMFKTPATRFLQPPQWLQGRWESDREVARINEGNIVYGDVNDTPVNYYQLASTTDSVFQLQQNDETTYSYRLTTVDSQGNARNIHDTFQSTGANTLTYTGSEQSYNAVHMTRQ